MSLGNKSRSLCSMWEKVNILNRTKLTDGFLCSTCKTWCSNFVQIGSMSSADVRTHISKTLQDDAIYSTLVPTESVGKYLVVFSKDRLWSCMVSKGESHIFFPLTIL